MGLDFSHCSAMWSYSGFNEFRDRIMDQLGYRYDDLPRTAEQDALCLLLNHSNCEGFLEPTDCSAIADRLYAVVRGWPRDDFDRYEAVELVRGLRKAAQSGERLHFR